MSENNFQPQDQRQRWLVYGSNVALVSVIVIVLAALVTYAAERKPMRYDATASGFYSLKPQTLKILSDLHSKVRLVSLYTRSAPPSNPDEDDSDEPSVNKSSIPPAEAAQTVDDLLDEYADKNSNITAESIDPVTSPTKVDVLIDEVESKYGGEVAKYRQFVKDFPTTIKQIGDIADPQVQEMQALPFQDADQSTQMTLREAYISVQAFPQKLQDLQDALQRPLHQRPPDYKGATDVIQANLDDMSQYLDAVLKNFAALQKRGSLPKPIAAYMDQSLPKYQDLKKLVDDTLAKAKGLGELKLDTLRTALKERNTILVMGDKEWRIIRFDQVWKPAARMSGMVNETSRPSFAGEQQVTAAILGVSAGGNRPKVCFVRAGGPPLTESTIMGPSELSEAADRLKLYNFDVTEKDLSGQYAAAMAEQGGTSEPSDADIKDALWIVYNFKQQQQNPEEAEQTPTVGPQLDDHLKEGGSAVVLTGSQQDALTDALAPWGVAVRTDSVVVHQQYPAVEGQSEGELEQALRQPFVFELHDYGDHPLAAPLRSLQGFFFNMAPVKLTEMAGYKASALLPIPTTPQAVLSWGETDVTPMESGQYPTYDPKTDVPPPLFAGAAVEKQGGGRLVVLAADRFMSSLLMTVTARALDPNSPPVVQFPANGELFTNSVFWAAHQDTLIDISPAAMDIGRIRDMTPAMLKFWNVGVLLIGLPGLVVVCGLLVYAQRRD